jgi:hypothetical protein
VLRTETGEVAEKKICANFAAVESRVVPDFFNRNRYRLLNLRFSKKSVSRTYEVGKGGTRGKSEQAQIATEAAKIV